MSSTAEAHLKIRTPSDLTTQWLSQILGTDLTVSSFTTSAVGTGQMSDCHRINISYTPESQKHGPKSVILKCVSSNENSRQAGVMLGLYEREVRFYAEVAGAIEGQMVDRVGNGDVAEGLTEVDIRGGSEKYRFVTESADRNVNTDELRGLMSRGGPIGSEREIEGGDSVEESSELDIRGGPEKPFFVMESAGQVLGPDEQAIVSEDGPVGGETQLSQVHLRGGPEKPLHVLESAGFGAEAENRNSDFVDQEPPLIETRGGSIKPLVVMEGAGHQDGASESASETLQSITSGNSVQTARVETRGGPGKVPAVLNSANKDTAIEERSEIRSGWPLAPCYYSNFSPDGSFVLILGDAAPSETGDDIQGATKEQAVLAMRALGQLHSRTMENRDIHGMEWINRRAPVNQQMFQGLLEEFLQRFEQRLTSEQKMICQKFDACFDQFVGEQNNEEVIKSIIHGDYRLDNLLFGKDGAERPCTVVDWQTVTWGPAMSDVSYFLGGSILIENRRQWQDELLREYHAALGPNPKVTIEQCRAGIRRQSFFGVLMSVISPIMVEETERGNDMFMAMTERHCAHVMDLRALEVLPQAEVQEPLRPNEIDEEIHAPVPEPNWQESYYFDFIGPEEKIGGYLRIGVDPAKKRTWYTAIICGPGRPTVAIVDYEAPVPDEQHNIVTSRFRAGHIIEKPLETCTVFLAGEGEEFSDPAMMIKDDKAFGKGQKLYVNLILTWKTAGTPYQYRITPRYEIPCTVSGTVIIGNERLELSNCLGQRDHSWGSRDWWAMDWVWSALHLKDGTHLHGLDLRIPNGPRMGMGYVQGPSHPISELSTVVADEEFVDDNTKKQGIPKSTKFRIEPGVGEVNFEVLGHGPLRLVADDGRVALFPRAWGRVKGPGDMVGYGWVEWNRNVR